MEFRGMHDDQVVRCVAALVAVLASPAALAAYGYGTVDVDGAGGNPAVTYEQVRFYTPGTSSFPTYVGSVTPDYCGGSGGNCGEPMTFGTGIGGMLTATATIINAGSKTNGIVYQDLSPGYGGLGVVGLTPGKRGGGYKISGDDEIDRYDVLTLSFAQQVSVVGFHFFEGDHSGTDWGDKAWLEVDGNGWQRLNLAPNYVTNDPTKWLTGTTFSFKRDNQDFYLGAVKIATPVPEPHAVLLGVAALGVLGAAVRRREPRVKRAA
jgi:hypothetical protein